MRVTKLPSRPGAATLQWSAVAPTLDPAPLKIRAGLSVSLLGPAISLAVLVAVLFQLRDMDWRHVWSIVPSSPLFWVVFAATYLAAPSADWLIFRRLWRIPASGLVALLRKLIGNEILLGYIGEVYFYTWARKRTDITNAPFGAIKDVAILSAMVGNMVTLIMLAIAWPLLGVLHLGLGSKVVLWSVATVVLTSLAAMLLRRRLFSLPAPELRFVIFVHLARIITSTSLAALIWHIALPEVALSWWLLLSTLRLLLMRLPFLPNKDLVFAGIAVFLIGRDQEIAALMTMVASLRVATHLILGLGLTVSDLATREPRS